ncbi:rRNA pseudouridine synthase [Treponema ruminis]|uniref:pseudouridine synthase n=2 Tax=Treponema ruminis TaxID=744515 RepID=UPI00161791F7|nr:pseudouridine synthase [Treponema ruminis]QSI02540.1 rRNA pseudouridine synthase [Treponema ruminis]
MKLKMRGSYLPDNSNSAANEEVRLQVFLAHSGVASRRASEKIILDGRVAVNGVIVTELGTKVSGKDKITVDGKPVFLEEQKRYVLLNKPLGYVCTQSDEKGRPCAVDLLREKYSERLYNVGRLDMFSHGALIFTNDGDFAAKLSHPSAEIEKEYIVESSLPLPRYLAEDFRRGVRVEGVFYKAKDVQEVNSHKMRVVLVEGKNREIRRVFENAGVAIRNLCRVRIGSVELADLGPGEFRDLTPEEVSNLLKLCRSKINSDIT